jgi:acyl-CoA reductase-like NAD-dependent aldehyde dehydrogenase
MTDVRTYQYFSNGKWLDAEGRAAFDVIEPYSRKVMARAPNCGATEVRKAIQAAHQAFPGWADSSPAQRATLFFKAAEIVKRRRVEIADILARETGSTVLFATFQQDLVIESLEQAAGWVYNTRGEVFPSNIPGSHSFSIRRPLGVVASFTPWSEHTIVARGAVAFGGGQHDRDETLGARANLGRADGRRNRRRSRLPTRRHQCRPSRPRHRRENRG